MADATFQRVDSRDDDAFGPPAVLLCGFSKESEPAFREVLEALGATEHRLVYCSPNMLEGTVEQALTVGADDDPAPPEALPQVVLLSGLSSAQIQGFLHEYRARGLPATIFASSTPTNLTFTVKGLLRELLREQREMSKVRG